MKGKLYQKSDLNRQHRARKKRGDGRDEFRRDFARLIHSPCFRRLQGKTQLFPSDENDFFRNRLTHSIEVAQIATGIAINLNTTILKKNPVNEHLVHMAALAHDLGHPPFGHNGEVTLDEEMKNYGGFEGNAQTLRILAKLEKKETKEFPFTSVRANPIDVNRKDQRLGLNLTYRSLAAIIKYDRCIPETEEERREQGLKKGPVKGYYIDELDLVDKIKKNVAPGFDDPFKTLECSIMDVADDIAYSTYDLEDAFKADFLSPIRMAAATANEKNKIALEINQKMDEEYANKNKKNHITILEIDQILKAVFSSMFEEENENKIDMLKKTSQIYQESCELSEDGYFRTEFTSKLVYTFINGVKFQENKNFPQMSIVKFDIKTFKMVEVLKKFAYRSIVLSPRLQISESRGREIIRHIFGTLMNTEEGRRLLPEDWRRIYFGRGGEGWRRRAVCDFIASMTDRYCLEFYSRLVGIDPPSIHKPY